MKRNGNEIRPKMKRENIFEDSLWTCSIVRMSDMPCQRSFKARRQSQSEQARPEREQPPIRSWPRLMAMKELPEAEIKVRQDTYASAFNSFISRLFYMSHDPSTVYLFDLWLMNGTVSAIFLFWTRTNRQCKIFKKSKSDMTMTKG